jgi:hypothetical protein
MVLTRDQIFTITNWNLIWSLHVKLPHILGGHTKIKEKTKKFPREAT